MRNLLTRALLAGGLLMMGTAANAQYRTYSDPYQERTVYGARLIDRVQADLDRAAASAFGAERYRIAQARAELNDVERGWNNGYADRRQLNQAIRAVERVLSSGRLSYRDRDILSDDLQRMRALRRQESWR